MIVNKFETSIKDTELHAALSKKTKDYYSTHVSLMTEAAKVIDWLIGIATIVFVLISNYLKELPTRSDSSFFSMSIIIIFYFFLVYFSFAFKKSIEIINNEIKEIFSLFDLQKIELDFELKNLGEITLKDGDKEVEQNSDLTEIQKLDKLYFRGKYFANRVRADFQKHVVIFITSDFKRMKAENATRGLFIIYLSLICFSILFGFINYNLSVK